MSNLVDSAESALTRQGWKPQRLPDSPILLTAYHGQNGSYECLCVVDEPKGTALCTASVLVPCPPDKRSTMLAFLNAANLALDAGSLEMHPEWIRARTAVDLGTDGAADGLLGQAMQQVGALLDRYVPGIAAIRNTSIGAEAALALVEHRQRALGEALPAHGGGQGS